MTYKQRKFDAAREYLCEPIRCIGWRMEYTWPQQENARLALCELLRRMDSKCVQRNIPCRQIGTHNYILNLFEAKKALDRQNYCFACNELMNVLYLNCAAQTVEVVRDLIQPYLERDSCDTVLEEKI